MAEEINSIDVFIKESSPNGGFLQSEEWRKFQESAGRRTYRIIGDNFYASVIKHRLPIVGNYFYIPRGPVMQVQSSKFKVQIFFENIIDLAKKEKASWIRIEPADEEILKIIKEYIRPRRTGLKIQKAPHDMQPREIFVIDITKSDEELLAEMKQKTRYNIKLSQKHNVFVKVISNFKFQISNQIQNSNDQNPKFYIDEFLKLVKITAKRDGITPHPESYYRKMFETIPPENLKLYIAEYKNKIIATNIIIHYGNTATYLHGASDNEYRNVMAPYLLQWQAILDAKKVGLERYDFGGVKTGDDNSWAGVTKFKTGFAPDTKPIEFPGSYDIIINSRKYFLYKFIRKFIP